MCNEASIFIVIVVRPDVGPRVRRIHLKRLSVAMVVAVVAAMLVPNVAQSEGNLTLVRVKAADYRFEGLPKRLEVGLHKFTFKNIGENPHMLIFVKNNSRLGNKKAFEKAMHDDEWRKKRIKMIGEAFAKPGEKGEPFTAWLKPGKYFGVCFAQDSKESPPHAMIGMFHGMRVE